jgi:DNA-binding response OmpR family regulator
LSWTPTGRSHSRTSRRARCSATPRDVGRPFKDLEISFRPARTAEVDRVVGLDAGADDYVVKPFSMPELISRVRAILRRRELDLAQPSILRVGALTLDLGGHTATVHGNPVRLTPSEFKLLTLFARNPERAFSRRELMQHLWKSSHVGDQRAGDAHIVNLRRKIGRDRLVTVRGVGYKLAAV